jgi:hypothetical protein
LMHSQILEFSSHKKWPSLYLCYEPLGSTISNYNRRRGLHHCMWVFNNNQFWVFGQIKIKEPTISNMWGKTIESKDCWFQVFQKTIKFHERLIKILNSYLIFSINKWKPQLYIITLYFHFFG